MNILGLAFLSLAILASSAFGQSAIDDGQTFTTVSEPNPPPRYATSKPLSSKGHWSFSMKDDSFEIRDGVLFEKGEPARNSVMVGVLEQPPSTLIDELDRYEDLNSEQRTTLSENLAKWYASYYGKALSTSAQKDLEKLYLSTSGSVRKFDSSHPERELEKLTDLERKKLVEVKARMLAELLVAERKIFGDNKDAQFRRYGKSLPSLKVDQKKINDLTADLTGFLTGQYLEAERILKDPVPPNGLFREVPADRAGFFKIVPYTLPTAPPAGVCTKSDYSYTTTTEFNPSTIGYEGRSFVATHPVTGSTWEDIGLPTMYHTSVVGGSWAIVQKKQKTITYYCEKAGLKPKEKGFTEQVTTQSQFDRWLVADGCAGTVKSGDEIALAYVYGGVGYTEEQVRKKLRGVSADSNGSRCRTRYGAFPVGFYGLQWVCHQNCNDFAHTKWKIWPIFYSITWVLFGTKGNWGITDIKAACECSIVTNNANHCCVPGHSCCYNSTYGQGSGKGYGLSVGWHPSKGWIDTECKFNSTPVSIPGPDTVVLSEELSTGVVTPVP